MILSRDLQEILEGVHYFLSEALPGEPLSGKLECLRRGLVLQLEALALSYPTLRIRARSSTSLPYLAMDQANVQGGHPPSESLSSGSSGGSNSYSNSSSGDGLVMGPGRGGCDTLDRPQFLPQDEEYEDFQDNRRDSGMVEERTGGRDDVEETEDVYMKSVDVMSFSNIIATCDKHGVLVKKTKGLLRNVKNHCVAANGMLYLYQKETDERQRKTIDLMGYSAREATGEDIRDQRKRDAAFEIVGPGKKTHTFIARTARDKMEWLSAIDRTIKSGRNRTQSSVSSASEAGGNTNTNGIRHVGSIEIILPPKAPPPTQMLQGKEGKPAEEYFFYHDVASDAKDEVYEEVDPDGMTVGDCDTLPPPPLLPSHPTQLPDYDPVCPDDLRPPLGPPLPLSPSLGRLPPGRPPLPNVLQEQLNKQAARPLPDAPSETSEGSDDTIGIYVEIEDDILEIGRENFMRTFEQQNEKGKTEATNYKESDQEKNLNGGSNAPALPARASSNSLVGFLSDEILMNISDFSPSHHLNKYPLRSSNPKTPPKLPPKGIPIPPAADDDSEYKVPVISNIDTEYQIPSSNPIPTVPEEIVAAETLHEISAPILSASQMYQVPPSQTIVSIKPTKKDRRNSVIEEQSKPLSSFFTGQEDPYPKNNFRTLTKRFEKTNDNQVSGELKDAKQSCQGTSVKDMIARLNKRKPTDEKDELKKEEPPHPVATTDKVEGDLPKPDPPQENDPLSINSEPKLLKPMLPPRPQNLLNGATITQKNISSIEEHQSCNSKAEDDNISDDDYYETPDDNSFDSSSQQDSQDTSRGKDTTAPWRVMPETAGEWFVAKFAFVPTIDQALGLNRGDEVLVYDTSGNSGWWRGSVRGRSGLVPREYLRKKE
ncbi:uncharacterized protein LOC121857204 [Homarus americanus]|uniref:uncharacterized protein LOC121857204 n=1 Tax=Homarus americanus TaxID=6706 RepID=UPI001C47F3A1|nr:uncharacterized protein LOC121857204 [Homarus americanus]